MGKSWVFLWLQLFQSSSANLLKGEQAAASDSVEHLFVCEVLMLVMTGPISPPHFNLAVAGGEQPSQHLISTVRL